MGSLDVDSELLQLVSHQMDLRQPNADALHDIALALSDHFDRRESHDTFEAVVDSATGVGKTYVMAATIDYLAQSKDWSNFVVIVPGRTILQKTIDNFTPGHRRDISGRLGVNTMLVTADNFDSPEVARQLDNPDVVKVFVFTVQALLRPSEALRRRTRSFSEGLGAELYRWLTEADDLVVLADEHHLYFGEQFSETIRGLDPRALVGFTATPHKDTPAEQIIFSYPLAAAIADKWVKTPVIVGRKDDRSDLVTRLHDGATLLSCKEAALAAFLGGNPEVRPINPFMLIVASNTSEADQIVEILRSDEFRDGEFRDSVIQVDSTVNEEKEPGMWSRLEGVDSPDSDIRIVVSVRMLKEGWDVRGVYVLLSTQPSISTILTEQVLGRGLRLPFESYTGVEMLDTLEVVAHERFSQLLERAGVLNEELVSYRVRTLVTENQNGEKVVATVQTIVDEQMIAATVEGSESEIPDWDASDLDSPGKVALSSLDGREVSAASEVSDLERPAVTLSAELPPLYLPKLRQVPVPARRSLADLTDEDSIESLGRKLRAQPEEELRRVQLTAVRVKGPDGVVRSETRQVTASDLISSESPLNVDLSWSRDELVRHVLQLPMVDASAGARSVERANAERIVDAFVRGLGDDAGSLLAAYAGRSAARLGLHVQDELRRRAPAVGYTEDYEELLFAPSRSIGTRTASDDIRGHFSKANAYFGWKKSATTHAWFDSEPERHVAIVLDEEDDVLWWLRLLPGDLTIAWGAGQLYNPDLLAAGPDGERWLIEVKADDRKNDQAVLAKRQSAKAWVNYVNGLGDVSARGEKWRYVLVSESDITQSHDSWQALVAFG